MLWPGDEEAETRYGTPVDEDELPLAEETKTIAKQLAREWIELASSNLGGGSAEWMRFKERSLGLYRRFVSELGPEIEVAYECMRISSVEMEIPRALSVHFRDDTLEVDLSDGRVIAVPIAWYPRLSAGSEAERNAWRLVGNGQGIQWTALDEDISVEGLIAGRASAESNESLARWLKERDQRGSRSTNS